MSSECFAFFLACGVRPAYTGPVATVINGFEAERGQFPWQVGKNNNFFHFENH